MNKKLVAIFAIVVLIGIVPMITNSYYEYYYQQRYRPLRMGTQISITWPTYSVLCSQGIPAYYEYYQSVPFRYEPRTVHTIDYTPLTLVRVYGIITASHCGTYFDNVYQNTVSSSNYIGYIIKDGRYSRGEQVRDNSLPDAAFVNVEIKYCDGACPGPSIVSTYIQHGSGLLILDNKIYSIEDLRSIYNNGRIVYKGGRTTGLTWGYVTTHNGWIYYEDPNYGPIFFVSYYSSSGDSGGIVYTRIGVGNDIDNIVMGIHMGKIPDSSGSYVRIAVPVFSIESGLNVNTYLGG